VAGDVAVQAEAGRLAEAEALRDGGDLVDADLLGEAPEVDVARLADRLGERDDAVAGRAVEDAAPELVRAVADHLVLGRDGALLEAGERGDELEGRARVVVLAERAVEEGLELVGLHARLGGAREVTGYDVRVEARPRDQREDAPGRDVDDGDGAGRVLGERLLGDALEVRVEREDDVVAGDRRDEGGAAQVGDELGGRRVLLAVPVRVDDEALDAALAAEVVLPLLLDAVAADGVAFLVALGAAEPGLDVADLVHGPQDVRGEPALQG